MTLKLVHQKLHYTAEIYPRFALCRGNALFGVNFEREYNTPFCHKHQVIWPAL